jgi:Xaa-Pro aminopeptidase
MEQQLFVKNRKKFVDKMNDNSVAVLFAGEAKQRSADQEYEFTPNRNFYYLTGIERQEFVLLISKYHGKVSETIFILKPDFDVEKWTGIRLKKDEVETITGITTINYTENFDAVFNRLLDANYYETIYIDTEYRTVGFLSKGLEFAKHIQTNFPYLTIKSAAQIIFDLRTIKEPEEVEAIRKAVDITKLGLNAIMKNLKPGLIERQVEAHYDFVIKYNGVKSRSFKTIAASGNNATILHYEENDSMVQDGQLMLFDLGCEYEYYCSDISRTYPVNGHFTDRQKAVYEAVLRVNQQVIEMIKPGILWKELHVTARDLLAEEAINLGLIKDKAEITRYYYHGIGHYLGLDVHDVGRYDQQERQLEPGMILTIEPGLYIAEESIGIRIEDNILVTEDGYENLSAHLIKSVEDIEQFMTKQDK